jgi:DNA-binding transcriptional MocR family regulator
MIDLLWNFPLLAGQGAEWQGYLRRAVDGLHVGDAQELRPTFRGADAELRVRAGKWLGTEASRTWIVCGGHHGVLVSLLAAKLPGKSIAVEEITYSGILNQARLLGIAVVGCAYDGEGMLPESLRARCEAGAVKAVYLMPTVHNPLGNVAGLERRKAIVAVAREFDLLIIEDDAYGFLVPDAPPNYAMLAPERTFYVRGLSKSYAPSTRTGFVIAPDGFGSAIEDAIKNSTTGVSLVHTVAALELIEDGTMERAIEAKRVEGAARNAMARAIFGGIIADGPRCSWHVWIRLPDGLTGADAQRMCEERGVLVSGADGFTVPGANVPHALRVGMGGEVERSRVEEGLRIVAEVVLG